MTGHAGSGKQPDVPPVTACWPGGTEQARQLQQQWALLVCQENRFGPISRVAGVDIGFEQEGRVTRAGAVLLSYPALTIEDAVVVRQPTTVPYIPGLLSFREAPAALAALHRLAKRPDLVLCDGQGIAHPRRFGLACHLGLMLDLPSIGVAKSRLIGSHDALAQPKGSRVLLLDGDERLGVVLRTRRGVKPVYVSCGHRIALDSAIDIVMGCITRYRLPETTRWAHRLASGPLPLSGSWQRMLKSAGVTLSLPD